MGNHHADDLDVLRNRRFSLEPDKKPQPELVKPCISSSLQRMTARFLSGSYFLDNRRHHRPHIHAKYQGDEAVIAIPEGELLEGSLPPGKMRLVLAWIEIHRDDLMANWELAASGQQPFRIEPLR